MTSSHCSCIPPPNPPPTGANMNFVPRSCRFSVHQVKSYIFQLLLVLEYLHARGFVHRDIKCANLLLADDNTLKLADFGLARSVKKAYGQLSDRVITLWYRPPELLLGETKYGGGVDMWSVGCILVELLTGRALLPARTEADQMKNITSLFGSPAEDSPLRMLPYWGKFGVDGKKSQFAAMLARHAVFADPELQYLVSRLLEVEPEKRITAREALSVQWFTSAPRISRDAAVAGFVASLLLCVSPPTLGGCARSNTCSQPVLLLCLQAAARVS
ncbi:hypothetical protein EON66_06215 [archaeon]|nr:MAG: hypothetical protein EON66_06215 [archaeon]